MKSLLRALPLTLVGLTLAAGSSFAGNNPSAVARLYWLTSNTVASTSRNSTAGTAKALITLKGVTDFRGGDVQLFVATMEASGALTEAWSAYSGGAAEANYTPKSGGFNNGTAATFPNIFTASPALPGVATSQTGVMKFHEPGGCITVADWGTIWLSTAGSAGVARTSTTEYGFFGFTLDLTTGLANDANSGSPKGVCIYPSYHNPCNQVGNPRHPSMAIVDGAAIKDYPVFETGFTFLTWFGDVGTKLCPDIVPVPVKSWGQVRRLYSH